MVGFSDYVAVLATVHMIPLIQTAMNAALVLIYLWMIENVLRLAEEKSEAVVLTKKWAYAPPSSLSTITTSQLRGIYLLRWILEENLQNKSRERGMQPRNFQRQYQG